MLESVNANGNSNAMLVSNAFELFNSLSDDKMREAYNFLSYLKDKEEWEATMELSSPEILNQIKEGLAELNSGNFVKFDDIKRNV